MTLIIGMYKGITICMNKIVELKHVNNDAKYNKILILIILSEVTKL